MKIGAIFPTTEFGSDPLAIRDWAQTAEELGYDHIITYDHVLGAEHSAREPALTGPYTEEHDFHEPFVLLAYLAGLSQRLELVTGVVVLPQRQTALVAKQAAELDILSSGRLRLGVGTGWNYVEYEALGVSYADRGKRYDEQIDLLRALWREPVLDYKGSFHRVDRAGIKPLPQREIPIWMGAFSPAALRRAARIGDGLLCAASGDPIRALWDQVRGEVEKAGRDVSAFGGEASVDYSMGADHWQKELESWTAAGGTHFSMRAMDHGAELMGGKHVGYKGPADYIAALEEFKRAIS